MTLILPPPQRAPRSRSHPPPLHHLLHLPPPPSLASWGWFRRLHRHHRPPWTSSSPGVRGCREAWRPGVGERSSLAGCSDTKGFYNLFSQFTHRVGTWVLSRRHMKTRNKLNAPRYCRHSYLTPDHQHTRAHFQSVPELHVTAPVSYLHHCMWTRSWNRRTTSSVVTGRPATTNTAVRS